MVKLSKRTDYAIQFLLAASATGGSALSVGTFSRESHISFLFMQHIVQILRMHGYLHVTRGRDGGYTLAKPIENTTVKEISDVMEGTQAVVPCIADPRGCSLSMSCSARKRFVSINQRINNMLDSISLAEFTS